MRKIIKKTVTVEVYVSGDGRETPVTEMAGTHLVNAFAMAVRNDDEDIIGVLKKEIQRRINATEEDSSEEI